MSQLITPPEESQEYHHESDPSKASPISRFFFLETVFAILLSILLVVGGLMAASTMVKEGNPDINFAIATIQTNWGGADPETIENQVTDKIEKELKGLRPSY